MPRTSSRSCPPAAVGWACRESRRPTWCRPGVGCRLVFQVADLDRERQRLIDNGVAVGEPVENHAEGYREIRFQDPEGYSLRFFAWNDPGRAGAFGALERQPVEDGGLIQSEESCHA